MPSTVYHFVTLVDGEPQCGCGPILECCLYPSSYADALLYPYTDLPLAITDFGETATANLIGASTVTAEIAIDSEPTPPNGEEIEVDLLYEWDDGSEQINYIGLIYTNVHLPATWVGVIFDEDGSLGWMPPYRITSGGDGATLCLINPTVTKDQFSNTYNITITGPVPGSGSVTRLDPIEEPCTWTGDATVFYNGTSIYKWTITGPSFGTLNKTNPQSSPVGTYTDGTWTVTVS